MITHQKEEWGVPRCFVFPVVVCKLGQREVSSPICLLVVSEEPEVRFYPLVVPL